MAPSAVQVAIEHLLEAHVTSHNRAFTSKNASKVGRRGQLARDSARCRITTAASAAVDVEGTYLINVLEEPTRGVVLVTELGSDSFNKVRTLDEYVGCYVIVHFKALPDILPVGFLQSLECNMQRKWATPAPQQTESTVHCRISPSLCQSTKL